MSIHNIYFHGKKKKENYHTFLLEKIALSRSMHYVTRTTYALDKMNTLLFTLLLLICQKKKHVMWTH